MDNILYDGKSEDYTVPRIEKPVTITKNTVTMSDKVYNINNISNVYMERKEKSFLVKILISIFAVLGVLLVGTQINGIFAIILGIVTIFAIIGLFMHKETNYLIYINNELSYQSKQERHSNAILKAIEKAISLK